MERVITPLRQIGATIVAEGPDQTAPLRVRGGSLQGINYEIPVASAQVKSAILLAGLFAKGKTTVTEVASTRNHTELMLRYFFVRTTRTETGAIGIFGEQRKKRKTKLPMRRCPHSKSQRSEHECS